MMKEDEQKKILLNYIYLSRQHAGGKDQVAINLLEGICKNKDMGACVVLCYDYAKAYLEQIAPGVTVITVKPPKKESELVRLLDIERVDIVNIHQEDEVVIKRDMYIPVSYGSELGARRGTIYNLTKEYEITKQGLRRWKKENGRVKAYYCSEGVVIDEGAYVDDFEKDAALIFC